MRTAALLLALTSTDALTPSYARLAHVRRIPAAGLVLMASGPITETKEEREVRDAREQIEKDAEAITGGITAAVDLIGGLFPKTATRSVSLEPPTPPDAVAAASPAPSGKRAPATEEEEALSQIEEDAATITAGVGVAVDIIGGLFGGGEGGDTAASTTRQKPKPRPSARPRPAARSRPVAQPARRVSKPPPRQKANPSSAPRGGETSAEGAATFLIVAALVGGVSLQVLARASHRNPHPHPHHPHPNRRTPRPLAAGESRHVLGISIDEHARAAGQECARGAGRRCEEWCEGRCEEWCEGRCEECGCLPAR